MKIKFPHFKQYLKSVVKPVLAVCCCTSGLLCGSAMAKSSVWEVIGEDSKIYIAGTLHVLKAEDFPLPEQFNIAYQNSQDVVFEIDIEKFNTAEVQMRLGEQVRWQQGKDLTDVLSDEVIQLLSEHMDQHGLPIEMLTSFKPGPAAMTLGMLELQRLGLNSIGVDGHFAERAQQDGRSAEGLETADQQIQMILDMGGSDPDEMMRYVLADLDELEEQMDVMRKAWREGDQQTLNNVVLEEMRIDYPEIYQDLIIDRNNAWLPKLELLLADEDTEVVMVGVGHLAGEHSVLKLLQDRGYTVNQLP